MVMMAKLENFLEDPTNAFEQTCLGNLLTLIVDLRTRKMEFTIGRALFKLKQDW